MLSWIKWSSLVAMKALIVKLLMESVEKVLNRCSQTGNSRDEYHFPKLSACENFNG